MEQARDNLSLKRWQKKEEEYKNRIRFLEEEISSLKKQKKTGNGRKKTESEEK